MPGAALRFGAVAGGCRHARRLPALAWCATLGALAWNAAAPAASGPVPVFRGVAHDTLFAVSVEGAHAIAVGDHGLIVESSNGGGSWLRQVPPPTELALLAVARRAGRCIAAGQQGLILVADDCRHWQPVATPTEGRILAVHVNSQGLAWAVGGFGTLLQSADWGRSWRAPAVDWSTLSPDGVEPHLYDVHVAEDGAVTVAGEFEIVMRSGDGGSTWQSLHQGRRSLFGLTVLTDGALYAVGQEGLVLRGSADGQRWEELATGVSSILTGLWVDPRGPAVATGIHTVLHSADGGGVWRADQSAPALAGRHQAVAATAGPDGQQNIFIVGSGGTILAIQP